MSEIVKSICFGPAWGDGPPVEAECNDSPGVCAVRDYVEPGLVQ